MHRIFFPKPHKEDILGEIIHFEIKKHCLEKKVWQQIAALFLHLNLDMNSTENEEAHSSSEA